MTSRITGKEMEWSLWDPDRIYRWQLWNVRTEHYKGHFMEEEGPQASQEKSKDQKILVDVGKVASNCH